MRFVVLGLSITSSWGNGHATTYRGLLRELSARGHDVLFLERDTPWYASNRDMPEPPFCRTALYGSLQELRQRFGHDVREADVVIVGSYVPDGVAVGEWVIRTATGVTAFYDIDTPVTLAKLQARDFEYLTPDLIARYQLYLSFTGGPTLQLLERRYGSPAARALYCSFDPELYHPDEVGGPMWDLGYMGTYSVDRQPAVDRLLNDAARAWPGGRFVVAGPQYPESVSWPANVKRIEHLPPAAHRGFYCNQRFTLNVTRAAMIDAGYSPSVRLFEAAACGTPIISDYWDGLESMFDIGREILVPRCDGDVLSWLIELPDEERLAIGESGRQRVLQEHSAAHRALELESHAREALGAVSS
jgi:spore maturation protein CgeB